MRRQRKRVLAKIIRNKVLVREYDQNKFNLAGMNFSFTNNLDLGEFSLFLQVPFRLFIFFFVIILYKNRIFFVLAVTIADVLNYVLFFQTIFFSPGVWRLGTVSCVLPKHHIENLVKIIGVGTHTTRFPFCK